MTFTEGAQCTSNFVFQDGSTVYIGMPVEVDGAPQPGTLAYNPWLTMQANGEPDEEICAYNDLALVRLDPADVANVNPSAPAFGGPTGAGSWGGTGSTVYTYGNSSLHGGVTALSPKQGTVVQSSPGGWSHDVYTLTPGIPGDSGGGFPNATGGEIGTLSTVQLAPLAGSNGVGDLPKEIACMQANGFSGVNLDPGTEPFNADVVGAVLNSIGLQAAMRRRALR